MQVLLLPVGTWTLAAELSACREVVESPRVTPLVNAPPTVLGLVNVRGAAVPVLDTVALLATDARTPGASFAGEPSHVVVVGAAGGPAALALSACPEPMTVDDDALTNQPEATGAGSGSLTEIARDDRPETSPRVLGTGLVGDRPVTLVDVAALVALVRGVR